jgi:acyl-[acyl-carrier-protein]-phospholipid O-acyltransferase/long-chain-fatty-acid--[acyl-carrier-protein] ligase
MIQSDDPQPRQSLGGLLVAQFTGAFNDSVWKIVVPLLAVAAIASNDNSEETLQWQMTLATVVFTIPMIVLSVPAAFIADRWSKQRLILLTKGMEVVLMAGATVALAIGSTPLGLVILALMGAQSALFSPAKYGILPEILPQARLSTGNAHLALWTLIAIVAGSAAGGWLVDATVSGESAGPPRWSIGAILAVLAAVGLFAATRVPRVAPAGEAEAASKVLPSAWRAMRRDRLLWLAILGSMLFWGLATLLSQLVFVYAKDVLGCSPTVAGATLAIYGAGVGIGSLLAGRWSDSRIEYGLIPLGALPFGVVTFAFALLTPGIVGTLTAMLLLGLASGFILVPTNALIQWRAPAKRRGAIIALENVLVFSSTLAGSLIAYYLAKNGISTTGSLMWAAVIAVSGTLWALWLMPDALLRFILVLTTRTLYRLKVYGREHVPDRGGALLVPNHVSFIDGVFLVATIDRPIRFIVDAGYFHKPWLKPFMTALGAIPISSSGSPRELLRAMKDAGTYLDKGELVCIFAEGQITRTGMLLSFRRGMERIAKGRNCSIIPVYLDRVWGSIFSREGGRFITKLPREIPYPITLCYGEPLPADTPIQTVRKHVQELTQVAWCDPERRRSALHHPFIRSARLRPFRYLFGELERPAISRLRGLAGAIALARAMRPSWRGQTRVGLLLPPSIAAALSNIGASMSGRSVVNLNYTAGPDGMASAARQSGLQTVVTSQKFLDKAGIELPVGVRPLWIEDIVSSITRGQRAWAMMLAVLCPTRWIERACGATRPVLADDEATIIFSSGSTGEPKGVILTHANVNSNVDGAAQVFRVEPLDRLLGILPLFHSFGFMAMWFVNNHGMGMAFHPNPIDALAIGELIQRNRVTILIGTPTFLQIYLRRCTPAHFGSLRIVVAGAEKLPQRLSDAFEEHFGIRPLEGYGTTECSPVVAVSVPDFRAPGFYQPGSRRGSVGHPLPGVAVRIVDPDTFDPIPDNKPGMLLVKGPNIMRGYLDKPELTTEVLRDGWYVTGDIAKVDDDGFITITDRLSRFSKIGGEMVPHGRIEEALHEAAETTQPTFAVTAVPDDRKGEALAVLHVLDAEQLPPIMERLGEMGLPNLFIPRLDHFLKVDALPMLGTGKLDLKKIKADAHAALRG